MNSVAPVWDGNETWLVLGGGGLLAVFPLAYSVILPALYIPVILMLLSLIFRGVAFEFRWRTTRWRALWDYGFSIGSALAAFCQGLVLGALVGGIEVTGREFSGGPFDFLTPFSIVTGLAVMIGYTLLGATWLVYKTTGDLQAWARTQARRAGIGTVAMIVIVSAWTPTIDTIYAERWFTWPTSIFSVLVPLLVAGCAYLLWRSLKGGMSDLVPFLASLGLFVLSFAGIGISFYPYIVPGALTIAEAAAPPESLLFLLLGALVLLPVILIYTAYSYWVFRGKVDPEEGYH
jgi:cytochrome d ubiquinol oxidase subunit II